MTTSVLDCYDSGPCQQVYYLPLYRLVELALYGQHYILKTTSLAQKVMVKLRDSS